MYHPKLDLYLEWFLVRHQQLSDGSKNQAFDHLVSKLRPNPIIHAVPKSNQLLD
jgi:hypothetical protein